jgi:hypothetical protein
MDMFVRRPAGLCRSSIDTDDAAEKCREQQTAHNISGQVVRQGFLFRGGGRILSEVARGKYIFRTWFLLFCNLEVQHKLLGIGI